MKRRSGDTVTATKLEYSAMFADDVPDGAFCFKVPDAPGRIMLVCPCGCKVLMVLGIRGPGAARTASPQWEWDGNEARPTLAPSIRDLGGCRFHGFLTNGAWTVCPDSGQGGPPE